jgi:GNAT superfamily N-acetyltransferase
MTISRPPIKIGIYRANGFWPLFARHHYLNHGIHKSSTQYVGFYDDRPVVFCSYIFTPNHGFYTRKVHRLVVLPDYQGIGIGIRTLDITARIESEAHEYVGITTSLNGFAKSVMKNENWRLISAGHLNINRYNKWAVQSSSSNRNTYSFRWRGGANAGVQ